MGLVRVEAGKPGTCQNESPDCVFGCSQGFRGFLDWGFLHYPKVVRYQAALRPGLASRGVGSLAWLRAGLGGPLRPRHFKHREGPGLGAPSSQAQLRLRES